MSTRDVSSALNALDLALETQRLEVDALESVASWLPLLDHVESVCRDFDRLEPSAMEARAGSVAALADLAARIAREVELARIEDVEVRVDVARHEVVATETNSSAPHGTILKVNASGWEFRGRVLRAAKVTVAGRG